MRFEVSISGREKRYLVKLLNTQIEVRMTKAYDKMTVPEMLELASIICLRNNIVATPGAEE